MVVLSFKHTLTFPVIIFEQFIAAQQESRCLSVFEPDFKSKSTNKPACHISAPYLKLAGLEVISTNYISSTTQKNPPQLVW